MHHYREIMDPLGVPVIRPVLRNGAARMVGGYLCDGKRCENTIYANGEKMLYDTLIENGWSVEHLHKYVIHAWCPQCRRGRST